jgi:hypothetical protein
MQTSIESKFDNKIKDVKDELKTTTDAIQAELKTTADKIEAK